MKFKKLLLLALSAFMAQGIVAQRHTDSLDRGLVAMKTADGIFCTWRINADEWDNGTQYNIYRGNTKLNSAPLNVSNFTDPSGSLDATYTVRAVVGGVESKAAVSPTDVWQKNYTIIKPKHAAEITAPLQPNDATVADVDGDGQLEIIMKYDNLTDDFHNGDNGIHTVIECLEMDGTVLWWINCGPNMGDFQNNEINIIATDWDLDGKAEVVFRAADGTVIHQADGNSYTVGDASINYRGYEWPGGQWFMCSGREYLVYANGLTGKPYQCIEYPLKRVEDDQNPKGLLSGDEYAGLMSAEWGDGYGHRSSKYFFAAPYLDGVKPSLFLGRGIYTKHKFITYDIDPASHTLVERWRWTSNDKPEEWFGQGYHNMGIADVDWDGKDEIVWGSMVIDDNGMGLSTTGFGHGDSQHCGDFDPYTHGLEIFACLEHHPNNNFRDATTSKVYYRSVGDRDDGRANCGNFIDKYPGAQGISSRDDNLIGGASHKAIVGDSKGTTGVITQNFRVYWDGDLCDETYDYSSGKNTAGAIYKAFQDKIAILEGSKTNNDTKGTPCFQGDILGDWREEYIMRDGDNNIRIYTTDIPTEYRIYSLWYDHQYRNAMNWQMCGYNQTPHVSFFLGAFENITVPPVPLTLNGRTEIGDNGAITSSLNGKNIVASGYADRTFTAEAGVSPALFVANTPTWVQGRNDNNRIITNSYTHTITGGPFAGSMRMVKQGDGKLLFPDGTHTYSGNTDVWAGTLALNGELSNSPVWLNRFGVLETKSLNIPKGLQMDYASVLRLGSDSEAGSVTVGDMKLGFGAIIEIDLFADQTADCFNASKLVIETKDWENGPEYLQPILKFTAHPADGESTIPAGRYLLGEIKAVDGNVKDLLMSGVDEMKKEIVYEDGKLYLSVNAYVPGNKTWAGGEGALWDLDHTVAFKDGETSESTVFVPGDAVTFDDSATSTDVVINGKLKPSVVTFNNSEKSYTLSGDGEIVGEAKLVKNGTGTLTVNNINSYTGGTYINGGKVVAGVLSNNIGTDFGSLSAADTRIYINDATLAVADDATLGQRITMQSGNATLEVPDGKQLTLSYGIAAAGLGQSVIKSGKGKLIMAGSNTMNRLVIEDGEVQAAEVNGRVDLPATVEFVNGTLRDPNNANSYTTNSLNFVVGEGNTGKLYLDSRCAYTGKLTGKGKFIVYANWIRHDLNGDWSGFEGELTAAYDAESADFKWNNNYGMPKATLNISNGVIFNAQGFNVSLGALKGSGTYLGTGTLTVGNDTETINFTGVFDGNTKVIKTGKCDWNVTKAMSGLSSLTTRDGTVSFNATKSPYKTEFFSCPVTVDGTSTLRGRGTVQDITVAGNATVEPGVYGGTYRYGPLFVKGSASFNPGTTLSLYLRAAGKSNDCSYLDVTGTLKLDGTVKVEMYSGYQPKDGDRFQLWKAADFSGSPTFDLPVLPEGLEWDTTELTDASGIIKVVSKSGIQTIVDDDTVMKCDVYNILGQYIGTIETSRSAATVELKSQLNPTSGIYLLKFVGHETLKIRI